MKKLEKSKGRLNPCFNGIQMERNRGQQESMAIFVLILVLMENGLGEPKP